MALIKNQFNIDAVLTPGGIGQFDVLVEGRKVAERGGNWISRKFGAGYPDLDEVVDQIRQLITNKKP